VPSRTASRSTPQSVVPTGLVAGLLLLVLVGIGLATAGPAAAAEDPTRPQARVVKGPSCRPGGMVIDVVARSVPYSVRLATTRTPSGEDEATVQPGATVTLRSGPVDWGETIDSRLEYTALDGSGTSYVDELDNYSFTRPTQADCAAAAGPPANVPSSSAGSSSAAGAGRGTDAQQGPSPSAPAGQAPSVASRPQQSAPAPQAAPAGNGHATVQSSNGGGTFTLRGSGFQPGERVTVHLRGSDAVLGSATAGPDGTVRTDIQLPGRPPAGGETVDLVGDSSAVTAGVLLQVASFRAPANSGGTGDLWALIAAAVALVGSVAALVSVAGQQRASARKPPAARAA
jgi:hypothetical protein